MLKCPQERQGSSSFHGAATALRSTVGWIAIISTLHFVLELCEQFAACEFDGNKTSTMIRWRALRACSIKHDSGVVVKLCITQCPGFELRSCPQGP